VFAANRRPLLTRGLRFEGDGLQAALFNIAQFLPQRASEAPDRAAVICTHSPDALGRTRLSFKELHGDSDALAWGLSKNGLKAGQRTLVMVRPGLDFISITFALFKLGAVPVLIDPGMGKKNLVDCIRQVRPEALIGISLAHALRVLSRGDAFKEVRVNVTVGRRWFWGGETLTKIRGIGCREQTAFAMSATTTDSAAAILFTTGSTGTPKGVLYRHGMFGAQVAAIKAQYGIEPGEVDLPAFPLFALFSTALGTTCVIPDMDPTRPAQCDPGKIVKAIQEHQVTYTFGSPSIWKRVGPYCVENKITLPSLKRILMAGAPVRGEVLDPFKKILSEGGDTFIPYGATESLPVSSMRGSEVLAETWELTRQGKGHCVGRPLAGVSVKIIKPDESLTEQLPGLGPVEVWDDSRVLPDGQIGEIAVKGAVVTQEYFEMPEQTRKAKIYEAQTHNVWHRIGDMGYFDASGRLWFCGRKAHRVVMKGGRVLYSVCVEQIFERALSTQLFIEDDSSMAPNRCALVGVGPPDRQDAAIVFEDFKIKLLFSPAISYVERGVAKENFQAWWLSDPMAKHIKEILPYPQPFPVDIRHNAKINREELGRWAEKQLAMRQR